MKKLVVPFVTCLSINAALKAQMNPAPLQGEAYKQEVTVNKDMNAKAEVKSPAASEEASVQTKQSFGEDFGYLPALRWKRVENFDEVDFVNNGKLMSAFYDNDAQLVGTTTEATFSDLPSRARSYIEQHYNQYSTGQVIFFDDNELNYGDMVLYGNRFEDKDSYFVELINGVERLVLQVFMNGDVKFFKKLS